MSSVIKVEHLSKSFLIHHEGRERYTALRDVISSKFSTILKPFGSKEAGLKKNTSELFWALDDVSFDVKEGDRIGIIGRNGAGKSTLLKILSRITEPTKGRIQIKGRVASLLEVGTGFHPELTGRENIFLNGAILGMSRNEIRNKFDEIVAFAEVERFLDTPVKRYSSGMYVRLAFAVAAHLEPEILVVDEVLAVGDAQFQKKCLGKMEDVSKNQGRTVLFVSHNMGVVAQLCQQSIVLHKGSVSFMGTTEKAIDHYLDQQQKQVTYYAENTDKGFYVVSAEAVDEDGHACNHFLISDKIRLKIKIRKNAQNPNVRFSVTIQNRNGDYLSTFIEEMGNYFSEDLLEKEFLVEYPSRLVAPNSYAFRFALFTGNGKIIDLVEMVCPFTIVDEGSDMAIFEGSHYGYFIPSQKFKLL
jgi:lipopolysaccharide transport system ATP-binding protein